MKNTKDASCVCEGQTDLTELVGIEHIAGSMPASDADRDTARSAFYDELLARDTAEGDWRSPRG